MFPKDWKWLVLAPAMTAFLTGCPDRAPRDAGPVSPYNGFWLNEQAVRDYEAGRRDSGHFDQVFCARVQNNPELHGCPRQPRWDGELKIQAWRVAPSGDVYQWAPTLDLNNPSTRQDYYVGHVNDTGFFTKNSEPGTPPMGPGRGAGYYYGGNAFNPATSWTQSATLSLYTPNRMIVYRNNAGRLNAGRTFARVTEAQLRNYTASVTSCARAIYGDPVASNGIQTQQPYAQQPYMQQPQPGAQQVPNYNFRPAAPIQQQAPPAMQPQSQQQWDNVPDDDEQNPQGGPVEPLPGVRR